MFFVNPDPGIDLVFSEFVMRRTASLRQKSLDTDKEMLFKALEMLKEDKATLKEEKAALNHAMSSLLQKLEENSAELAKISGLCITWAGEAWEAEA